MREHEGDAGAAPGSGGGRSTPAGAPRTDTTDRQPQGLARLRERLRLPGAAATGEPRSNTVGSSAASSPTSASGTSGPGVRGRGREAVDSWRRYRETQLAELAESNRLQRELVEGTDHRPGGAGADGPAGAGADGAAGTGTGTGTAAEVDEHAQEALPRPSPRFDPQPEGTPKPEEVAEQRRDMLTVTSPFMFGFFGALGVLAAWWLAQNVTRLSSVITFVLVAVFLTLALNPIVESLTRRGFSRLAGVLTVFLGLLLVLAVFGTLVVPPIVSETGTLFERAPRYLEDLSTQPWVSELEERYDLSARLNTELENRLQDSTFISMIFGGVLGAAGWLAGGLIGVLTVLVLTLYFLAALPTVKEATYKAVPRSRRPRVIALAEEIMRRVGGYALGQVAVATINGTCSWIMMAILDVPYAVVLAVAVGILGLIPLVGATIGAILVAAVALSQGVGIMVIVLVYYVIYQQIENYVIVPRIMSRTVSVPGAIVVVAVLAGGTLMGVLGALVAIPVAAGLLLLYNEVVIPRQARL